MPMVFKWNISQLRTLQKKLETRAARAQSVRDRLMYGVALDLATFGVAAIRAATPQTPDVGHAWRTGSLARGTQSEITVTPTLIDITIRQPAQNKGVYYGRIVRSGRAGFTTSRPFFIPGYGLSPRVPGSRRRPVPVAGAGTWSRSTGPAAANDYVARVIPALKARLDKQAATLLRRYWQQVSA